MSYEIAETFPDDRRAARVRRTGRAEPDSGENAGPGDVGVVEGGVLDGGTAGTDTAGSELPPADRLPAPTLEALPMPAKPSRPKTAAPKAAVPKAAVPKTAAPKAVKAKAPKAKAERTSTRAGQAGHPAAGADTSGTKAARKARVTPLALVVVDAEDDAPETAPGVDESDAAAATRSRARRLQHLLAGNFVATLLAVVVVALAVSLALTMSQLGNQNAIGNARTTALTAAKAYSVEIASYDYRHLDADFGAVLANSTPSFRASFSQSSNALKSTLTKYHATASATVVAAGIVSATTSRAEVLVFLDQQVTNSTQKGGPTTDRSQVEITLLNTGGKWLIDQVTLL